MWTLLGVRRWVKRQKANLLAECLYMTVCQIDLTLKNPAVQEG